MRPAPHRMPRPNARENSPGRTHSKDQTSPDSAAVCEPAPPHRHLRFGSLQRREQPTLKHKPKLHSAQCRPQGDPTPPGWKLTPGNTATRNATRAQTKSDTRSAFRTHCRDGASSDPAAVRAPAPPHPKSPILFAASREQQSLNHDPKPMPALTRPVQGDQAIRRH
jgi:hypothetical protein